MKFEFRSLSAAHEEIARLREALRISESSLQALATFDGFEARGLQHQIRDLTELLAGRSREILVERMHFEDGTLDAWLKHPIFGLFISVISDFWFDSGAKNCLEIRGWAPPPGPGDYVVTIQKLSGKTPLQLKDAALLQAENLAGMLEGLLEAVAEAVPVHGDLVPPLAIQVALSQGSLLDYEKFTEGLNSKAPAGSDKEEAR